MFGAPVGLSTTAGLGGDELLVALGTYESVDADPASSGYEFNPANDCSIITLSVTGSAGAWTLTQEDNYPAAGDPDGMSCVPPDDGAGGYYHEAVDGFGGEPVPYGPNRLLASRYYGKLFSLSYGNVNKNLSKNWAAVLETPTGHEFRQPPEHSPVFTKYPNSNDSVALWGANQYLLTETEGVITGFTFLKSVVLEVDIDALEIALTTAYGVPECDSNLNCAFDVTSPPSWARVVGEIGAVSNQTGPLIWGPGAAGTWVNKDDPDDQYLAYVLATAANTAQGQSPNSDTLCDGDDVPPQLHFFYKKRTWTSWQHDTVDLTTDTANPECYEVVHDPSTGAYTYPRIEVPGGVAIRGHAVYVATDDGRFWMYGTMQGVNDAAAPNGYRMAGPATGWPQFRKNLLGSARDY